MATKNSGKGDSEAHAKSNGVSKHRAHMNGVSAKAQANGKVAPAKASAKAAPVKANGKAQNGKQQAPAKAEPATRQEMKKAQAREQMNGHQDKHGGKHGKGGKEGKEGKDGKGFLTYDEVSDQMPADNSVQDQVDDVIGVLGDEDIEIVDAATQVKIAPTRIVAEENAEKKNVPREAGKEDEDGGYYSKSNDPVRMYLRKMGSVSLLTREGEVEIAKRIEQGEHTILGAILNSPVAVREIIDLGDKLRKHKIRVKEIIRDAEDEDREFDEEEADRRILRLIDKVKHLDKVGQDLIASLDTCAASRKKGIEAEIEGNKFKMVETLEEMRLNKKTIDRVVMKLRSLIQKIERAESGSTELEKRTGVDMDQLRKEARLARGDINAERKFKRRHTVTPDEVLANHAAATKNLRKVEEELQLDIKSLRKTYEEIR
ncbi:MAG: sigma-70 factor domain-containing protein, partial [Polyangiaceae bacterium]